MIRPAEAQHGFRRPAVRRATTRYPNSVVVALRAVLTALLVLSLAALAACGDDDDDGDRSTGTTTADDGDDRDDGSAIDTDEPADGEDAALPSTVDRELLEQAHAHMEERLRILAGPAMAVPLTEFARAADAGCRAAEQAGPDTDAIAAAVAASLPEGPDVPQWRGAALSVTAQYIFLGGCEVPDAGALIGALAPHITAGLTGG